MIVIVGGMHRSGTSAMAGMLHANEVIMGKDEDWYPPPMKENPKGFYENVRFRRVNDRILKENMYKVKSFIPSIPEIKVTKNEKIRDKMKELITEFMAHTNWGWKDPRTCLTFGSWYSVLEELGLLGDLKVVFMMRPSVDVANSMKSRGNKETHYDGQFDDLAIVYVGRLRDELGKCGIPPYYVEFHDLLHHTKDTVDNLQTFLGINLPKRSFIDPHIARNIP